MEHDSLRLQAGRTWRRTTSGGFPMEDLIILAGYPPSAQTATEELTMAQIRKSSTGSLVGRLGTKNATCPTTFRLKVVAPPPDLMKEMWIK